MKKPLIYLITDGSLDAQNYSAQSSRLVDLVEVAVTSGVSMVQIREKNLSARLLLELTSEIVKIQKKSTTKILVNDRADVAFAAKADGVHLTANSIPTKIIRQNFSKNFLIGVSTHSVGEAVQAKKEGADFAVFGPVFYTPKKGEPQGINRFVEVVEATKNFPILALGGINAKNFAETLNAGASGIAAIKMLNDSRNLPKMVKMIQDGFGE